MAAKWMQKIAFVCAHNRPEQRTPNLGKEIPHIHNQDCDQHLNRVDHTAEYL